MMNNSIKKYVILSAILMSMFLSVSASALNFVANRIQFQGLHRIPLSTAQSYLPVHAGARINTASSTKIIQALFKTGFFKNVNLLRRGSTLIIRVQERPTISEISLSGNKVIKSKALLKVLQKVHIAEGYAYNRSTIKEIESALLAQYYSHGLYNAHVHIQAKKGVNKSVALKVSIAEGASAKIKQIHLIGAHHFSEHQLLGHFSLSTPDWLSWFTHNDEYASEKLAADLEKLRSYYLNRGYLKMRINSTQVSISPDRKHVYIVIKITEGAQYRFSGFSLSGHLIVPKQKLRSLVPIKTGAIFSRKSIVSAEKGIGYALGDKGYAKAKIRAKTTTNEKRHTVFIHFMVTPGRRVYVRYITFSGNSHTDDNAFRRVLTQMEGGIISTRHLANSKQRLMQQAYVQHVDETTTPVPGKSNEEDINYKVATYPAGEVRMGVGYGDVDGIMVNAAISQKNFFGTGNQFGISASWSKASINLGANYFNPYYTAWGVGRGFNVYATRVNADKQNIADFATNNYGAAMNYSFPIALHDSLQLGVGLDYLYLKLSGSPSTTMAAFKKKHGANFTQVLLNAGWTHNNLNAAVFPTKGLAQTLSMTFSVPMGRNGLQYYTADYNLRYFHPVYRSFVFTTRAELGYGQGYGRYGNLPFFKNFYAGGLGSIAGYVANTIGPQDSNGDSLGGNFLADGRLAMIVPNPISKTVRTKLFVDGGNVFNTKASNAERARNKDRAGFRYSSGMEVDWLTPFAGVLKFSLAKSLNPSKQDDTEFFQFSIGTSF
jgi:outer membrane protein insertion porin family